MPSDLPLHAEHDHALEPVTIPFRGPDSLEADHA
jgi:hypothetical protein